MKINLQLYSIKEEIEKDFFKALEAVAKMGYSGVEFAGFHGIKAEDMKRKLDELGLEAVSAHFGLDDLQGENLEYNINYLKTVGAKFIVCPYTEMRTVAQAMEFVEEFNKIGKICLENGLIFAYHNHEFEFIKDGDELPIEALYKNVDTKYVKQQPDIFWIEYAGLNALNYVKENKERCPIIHIKQIRGKENVNAGNGELDIKKLIEIAPNAVYVYEQEEYMNSTPMDCVAKSAEYLLNV